MSKDKPQATMFKEAARELETDDDPEQLKKLVKPKPAEKKK